MLLLDEPTNHLDAESVAWLQRFLHDFPGTVVTITHDGYFLDEVAGWILELDRVRGFLIREIIQAGLSRSRNVLSRRDGLRIPGEIIVPRVGVGALGAKGSPVKIKAAECL